MKAAINSCLAAALIVLILTMASASGLIVVIIIVSAFNRLALAYPSSWITRAFSTIDLVRFLINHITGAINCSTLIGILNRCSTVIIAAATT